MEVLTLTIWKTSTCPTLPIVRPNPPTFTWLDELVLEVVGQYVEPKRAVLAWRIVYADQWSRRCGCQGVPRGTVVRRLAHEPFGWRPKLLLVSVRRYSAGDSTSRSFMAASPVWLECASSAITVCATQLGRVVLQAGQHERGGLDGDHDDRRPRGRAPASRWDG